MADFEILKQAIFAKRPILKEILDEKGELNLIEYAAEYKKNLEKAEPDLQREVIEEIKTATEKLLSKETAESVAKQLADFYYVSTTDHHGPISHPFFVHSDILGSLPDSRLENFIVLACSNVSLNNSSLPRSILFHASGRTDYERINFFPSEDRQSPVFGQRSYNSNEIAGIIEEIKRKYPKALEQKLCSAVEKYYGNAQVLAQKDFGSQMTVANFLLWKDLLGGNLKNLVYLELEKVVSALIIKYHLDSETQVHKFIFDTEILKQIEQIFEGVPSAFSKSARKGTFLFWYFSEDTNARKSLWLEGDHLVSKDGSIKISLEPSAIEKLLESGRIAPSIMLSLAILRCYYGLRCLGGFSQVQYEFLIEQGWNKIFAPENSVSPEFGNLCGEFVLGLISSGGDIGQATALDFVLYGDANTYEHYLKAAKNLTLAESVYLMMPETYKVLYSAAERDPKCLAVTQKHIMQILGLEDKLKPVLNANL